MTDDTPGTLEPIGPKLRAMSDREVRDAYLRSLDPLFQDAAAEECERRGIDL